MQLVLAFSKKKSMNFVLVYILPTQQNAQINSAFNLEREAPGCSLPVSIAKKFFSVLLNVTNIKILNSAVFSTSVEKS